MKKTGYYGVVLIALYSMQVFAQHDKPLTYQDCLLAATWHGQADNAERAKWVERDCRERFPDTAPNYSSLARPLTKEAVAKIDLTPQPAVQGRREGMLYNGNHDITVTQVVVLITPQTGRDALQDFFDSEEYEINLDIPPNSRKSFVLPQATDGGDLRLRWQILHAQGY